MLNKQHTLSAFWAVRMCAQVFCTDDALSLAVTPMSSNIMVIPWASTLCHNSAVSLWAQSMSCHVDLQTASCTLVTISDLTLHLQADILK